MEDVKKGNTIADTARRLNLSDGYHEMRHWQYSMKLIRANQDDVMTYFLLSCRILTLDTSNLD